MVYIGRMSLYDAVYFLFGLAVGSFLNVCIHRLPRRESIVFPGSHCPRCGHAVRPYDNIPVISYLVLRGKCRDCGNPISPQYPVVELITGIAFLACALKWEFEPATFVNSLFEAILVCLVFIDYRHQILPDAITIPGTVVGILLSSFQAGGFFNDVVCYNIASSLLPDNPERLIPWAGSIFGAVVGGGVLLVVGLAYKAVRKRQGLGMGDVKMMAMVGGFLGWRLALLTVFFGSFIGSIAGVFLILFRGRNLQHKLAFGTFLGVAATLALLFGPALIDWYVSAQR